MKFILASASPRREELLKKILDDFEIIPSQVMEKTESDYPDEMAIDNALAKANDIAEKHPDDIILGFDTVIVHNFKILGKPRDLQHAKEMLAKLSGDSHDIVTGYGIVHKTRKKEIQNSVFTGVTFKKLSQEQIDAYVDEFKPLDKAGGYDIAEIPENWVDMIMGSYSNVRGLPLEEFRDALQDYLDILLEEMEA